MAKGNPKRPTVDEVISRAVIATRLSCAREPKDVFKATEKRLYAYPVLMAKIQDDEELLEEVQQYGIHQKSHSITRFIRSGTRLDQEDIKQAVIIDLEAAIAADRHEIERIDKALGQIADDGYRELIRYKYFAEIRGRNRRTDALRTEDGESAQIPAGRAFVGVFIWRGSIALIAKIRCQKSALQRCQIGAIMISTSKMRLREAAAAEPQRLFCCAGKGNEQWQGRKPSERP